MSRTFAEITMVAHFAYLAFVVFGGFLAWRWPRMIVAHLIAAGWGVAIVAAGPNCPLTFLEDRLRRDAGQPGLPSGFIDTYIEGVLYPERYARLAQVLAGLIVVVSWVGAYLVRRARRKASAVDVAAHVNPPSW